MKIFSTLLVLFLFILSSCNSNHDDNISSEKKDSYTFTTTLTQTCSPNLTGYPNTTHSVTKMDGITESEAKAAAEKLTMSSKSYSGKYTFTSTWTCEYILTSKYVAPTGSYVLN